MWRTIEESSEFIKTKISQQPELAIILGTGLGGLADEIQADVKIPYSQIPNFPVSTVEGHEGQLIFGKLGGKYIVAMQGRFHYYEGYNMQEVTFPIRVLKMLGIDFLIVSNASGGVNPDFEIGDIMLINDHINFFPEHPLRGPNDSKMGPRFPDMSGTYNKELILKTKEVAKELGIKLQEGIYLGVSGPTFETPAEYVFYRRTGADTVGMSTVPEVIVARHMNMTVLGLSVITDLGVPGKIIEVTHEEVQIVAKQAEIKMTNLITKFLEK
ncbi:MAG: purine-nucleoside phosphorylase [Bacteroidales bacterium]|nr:purine-nucleoside phosphorylase [Bacteroidales bacterium]